MIEKHAKRFSPEELANAVTHGVGLILSIAGLVILIVLAATRGSIWHIVSCAIYGGTLVCLYTASTLYHGIPSARLKRALKIFDHCAIYLLIAGTYTPFLLVNLRGAWGWSLFGVIWGMALVGILLKFWFVDHFQILSTTVYLLMGWLAVIAVRPILLLIPVTGLVWLAAGGLFYTAGVVFFAWKRIPYHHVIWHVFVLGGSTCHYFAVLYSVVLTAKA
jgi:hemolysin III